MVMQQINECENNVVRDLMEKPDAPIESPSGSTSDKLESESLHTSKTRTTQKPGLRKCLSSLKLLILLLNITILGTFKRATILLFKMLCWLNSSKIPFTLSYARWSWSNLHWKFGSKLKASFIQWPLN